MSSKNNNNNDKKQDKFLVASLVVVAIIALAIASYFGYRMYNEKKDNEVAYTELITDINENKIEKIKMTAGSSSITVTYKGSGEEEDRQKTVLVPSLQEIGRAHV